MPASAKDKLIEVWFQDEARVGQKGGHAYIWAKRGSRPAMVRDNRYASAYLYGAICPAHRKGAAVIMPAANTAGMNEHLQEISAQVAPGAHAVLVCDGAGWHQTGQQLQVPDNITLIRLPPYAPELNRWNSSGNTCAPTSSVGWSGTAMKRSSWPASKPGTS